MSGGRKEIRNTFTNLKLLCSNLEAREHGVGFYEFSTDHEERDKQQEALAKIREATLDAQQQRADLKKSRDNIITHRMKQAKARVRARLGLPPEEEKLQEEKLYDNTDKKREEIAEADARKKAEFEKQKEAQRQMHVRPWDKNKNRRRRNSSSSNSNDEEVEWKPQREHHLLSQGDIF